MTSLTDYDVKVWGSGVSSLKLQVEGSGVKVLQGTVSQHRALSRNQSDWEAVEPKQLNVLIGR